MNHNLIIVRAFYYTLWTTNFKNLITKQFSKKYYPFDFLILGNNLKKFPEQKLFSKHTLSNHIRCTICLFTFRENQLRIKKKRLGLGQFTHFLAQRKLKKPTSQPKIDWKPIKSEVNTVSSCLPRRLIVFGDPGSKASRNTIEDCLRLLLRLAWCEEKYCLCSLLYGNQFFNYQSLFNFVIVSFLSDKYVLI